MPKVIKPLSGQMSRGRRERPAILALSFPLASRSSARGFLSNAFMFRLPFFWLKRSPMATVILDIAKQISSPSDKAISKPLRILSSKDIISASSGGGRKRKMPLGNTRAMVPVA